MGYSRLIAATDGMSVTSGGAEYPAWLRRGVVADFDIVHPEEIGRSPYYQELLAPFKLQWFAGVKVAAGDDLWCLTLQARVKGRCPARRSSPARSIVE